MNTNIILRTGQTVVKWFVDYAAAKAYWMANKTTVKLITDRMGNIV